jgi:ABC-type multidrug transport system ATPase subunit
MVLNGSDQKRAETFSRRENPDLLSGGQQQKILMDIVLDEKKPVWFLDEPLSNLDVERRHYFWKSLDSAFQRGVGTIFFIDHWMGAGIKNNTNFRILNTLRVYTESYQNESPEMEFKQIDIYENNSPRDFFHSQITGIEREKRHEKTEGISKQ